MKKKEISYGIIPLRQKKEKWEVLLIHQTKGHWTFPKGHANEEEAPLETAARELKEETGLHIVSVLSENTLEEHYFFTWEHALIEKTVLYYVAEVAGRIKLQAEEVEDAKWLSFQEAEKRATFSETKKICRQLIAEF